MTERRPQWYTLLNKYHWFVLAVAALGWLFDTMDQQLFTLARVPAMNELLAPSPGTAPTPEAVAEYGGYATAIFLMGWATGGLFFGVLGDRIGRARTMLLTILLYSLCTGLSAFSIGFYDFAFYRFITGLGVGGEFAVGVALVAEAMPAAARPFALGLLQSLSAVGNVMAALIFMGLGELEEKGILGELSIAGFDITIWRAMFLIGTLPALLAVLVRGRLKEPDTWREAKTEAKAEGESEKKRFGSYKELLGTPLWRNRAFIGLALAIAGVIGVWGIGFFTVDLIRSSFRKAAETELRAENEHAADRDLILLAVRDGKIPAASEKGDPSSVKPVDILNSAHGVSDAKPLWGAALALAAKNEPIDRASLLAAVDPKNRTDADREAQEKLLQGEPSGSDAASIAASIAARSKELNAYLTWNISFGALLMQIGAFFGMYAFTLFTDRVGRRLAFAVAFVIAACATITVFALLSKPSDLYWMMPMLGFCILSPFGGYAIYFPELFPTHLRSTGTSFCYNVGRFLAATGPAALGLLTSVVFNETAEPIRWAGITMCSAYLIGLAALPFAPETKGQPLPEGFHAH